jgi:hypothetical protein
MTASHRKPVADQPIYNEDEIDLRQLARALWVYRYIIVAMLALGMVAGLVFSLLTSARVSEALFLTPKLALADYKQYEAMLDNEQRMRQFIEIAGLEGSFSASRLLKLTLKPGAMWVAVRPVFSLTGRDEKTFDIRTEEESGLVGFHLTMPSGEGDQQAPIVGLSEYLRSTIVEVDLKAVTLEQCAKYRNREQELRNEQLEAEFKIRQQQARVAGIRKIIAATPNAAALDNRQVVSLEKGGEKFLSPLAQLMAAEIDIADMRVEKDKRLRDRTSAQFKKAYYCGAKSMLAKPHTAQETLAGLEAIHKDVFKDSDFNSDVVEQTSNELEIEWKDWQGRYLEQMRFVVSPEGHEREERLIGLGLSLGLGAVLGLLAGMLLALFVAWWHDNGAYVTTHAET